jgi:hypothetical protein
MRTNAFVCKLSLLCVGSALNPVENSLGLDGMLTGFHKISLRRYQRDGPDKSTSTDDVRSESLPGCKSEHAEYGCLTRGRFRAGRAYRSQLVK